MPIESSDTEVTLVFFLILKSKQGKQFSKKVCFLANFEFSLSLNKKNSKQNF